MENTKLYAINIKYINKVFNLATCEYDVHRDYITTVHGNRLEVESGTWYLWADSWLVTSGNTRDLHAVHNRHNHNKTMEWDDIELDYTPVSYN